MPRSVVATDSFTYADGDLETVSSGAWASMNPSFATPQVTSGKATTPHVDALARWVSGTWTADQYAKAAVGGLTSSGHSVGVAVRISADTNANRDCYYALVEDGVSKATVVGKLVNGSDTELSRVTEGWANGDIIELEAEGTTIRVFKNGALLRSVTDAALAGASTDRAGIIIRQSGVTADDWEGGNMVASAPAPQIGDMSLMPQAIF